nr:MAG TPA: hypothetical protein [Caudoviricetes sp.]
MSIAILYSLQNFNIFSNKNKSIVLSEEMIQYFYFL